MDCGDLHCRFARVRCDECGHEYLLAFSCKRRHPRLLEDKLLPVLPSEKSGRIRRMDVDGGVEKSPAQTVGFQYTQKTTHILFMAAPGFHDEHLEEAFQYEVFMMLKKEEKINDAIIENMLSWHHTGFHVYIGNRIQPEEETALGNLAKYIVRACFSQQRMVYIPTENSFDGLAKVIYTSKDGAMKKTFDALDWAGPPRITYCRQIRTDRQVLRILFE